jgi:hypothetical protein
MSQANLSDIRTTGFGDVERLQCPVFLWAFVDLFQVV